jgi:hypothetical protein
MTCDGVQNGERCGAKAPYVGTFPDGTRSPLCEECAMRLQATAQDLHSSVRVEHARQVLA